MPTEPDKNLLDRDASHRALVIQLSTDLLREQVNYATSIIESCRAKSPQNDEATLAIWMLYLHVVEMVDGIEILLAQGALNPAQALSRSAFEGLLSLKYILEPGANYTQRALAWFALFLHDQIESAKQQDPNTPSGAAYQQAQAQDAIFNQRPLVDQARLQVAITERENKLAEARFQAIETEIAALMQRKIKHPKWYQLFGGPRDLRQLAKRFNREADYLLLYPQTSTIVHALDAARFLGVTPSGAMDLMPLRQFDVEKIKITTMRVSAYLVEATQLVVTHFCTQHDISAWVAQEMLPRATRLSMEL